MSDNKATRLSKIAREYNVGLSTIVEFLHKKGHNIDPNPNTKIAQELCDLLVQEYSSDLNDKKKSESFSLKNLREKKESVSLEDVKTPVEPDEEEELFIKDSSSVATRSEPKPEERPKREMDIKVVGKVDLDAVSGKRKPAPKPEPEKETPPAKLATPEKEKEPEVKKEAPVVPEEVVEKGKKPDEKEIKVVGRIDLEQFNQKPSQRKKKDEKAKVTGETPVASEKPGEVVPEAKSTYLIP
jgi:translation initiation factor IF-2